jgi:pyruvate/2-oxoglutarate dehydrogenase complex dihydrolipoamide acyltransferase (E2) component
MRQRSQKHPPPVRQAKLPQPRFFWARTGTRDCWGNRRRISRLAAREIVPMSRLRRTVAERLVEAHRTAALLTTFNEVDMTQVMAFRREYGEAFPGESTKSNWDSCRSL